MAATEGLTMRQAGGTDGGLARGVAEVLGRSAVRIEALSPGSSRGAARVLSEDGEPIAFLRIDLGIESDAVFGKSLPNEIQIVRRAHALGFPAPRVFALLEAPLVAVMELAAGTSRPDPEEAERVGPEFMGHIARLHTVAPEEFGLAAPATVTAAIEQDLAAYVADAERRGITRHDLVRLAARILRQTLPHSDAPPAMLHGDVGAGNFMAHEGRVSAILDWELAHAGDIHEDIAWLWTRGAHTPFGDPRQRIAEYEQAAGHKLDPARLDWHVAFVTFKSVIGLQRRMHMEGEDPGLLTIQIAILTYEALLAEALAKVLGVSGGFLEAAPESRTDAPSRLIHLLGALAPPSNREGEVLLQYLQAHAEQGDWRGRALAEDARRLLGVGADDLPGLVDTAAAEAFPALLQVVGAAAGRRCKASPNAERRVRRALAIGMGQ